MFLGRCLCPAVDCNGLIIMMIMNKLIQIVFHKGVSFLSVIRKKNTLSVQQKKNNDGLKTSNCHKCLMSDMFVIIMPMCFLVRFAVLQILGRKYR